MGLLAAGAVLADLDPFGVPTGDPNITPFVVLMILGFVVGAAGHLVRSSGMVALGIGLMFLGILVLPLLTHFGGS